VNQFGTLLRVQILGESHGECVGVLIDGCPAGISISELDFNTDLERRKGGQMATTPRKEDDIPLIKTGIFKGYTTGAPILILFENKNIRSEDYEKQREHQRPGHADFVAHHKFGGFEDYRGSGHFSGRLTVVLVAAGVIAKKIINPLNISSQIIEIAGEDNVEKGIEKAIQAKDSVGGILECVVTNVPIGLGELFGSEHNDSIISADGKTETNHAAGIVGGITNGNDIVFKIAVKPTSSTPKMQKSLNWENNTIEEFSIKGRHDLCIALRVPPVLEAVTAIVLADLLMAEQKIPRIWK
jgi:chorismate synthase